MIKYLRVLSCLFLVASSVASCKFGLPQSNVTATDEINAAYRGVFNITSDMFVPFPNIGYDKAFCAGTSTLHATAINRMRFFDANPPSLKCPSKFTVTDDAQYESAAWLALKTEALARRFVGNDTINIYGAKNFREFGSRNLHNFSSVVQALQSKSGDAPHFIDFWNIDDSIRVATFEAMARTVRQGNFLVVFVHTTGEDPDKNLTGTMETLKQDCEARGYVWDPVARKCDWSKQLPDDHPYKPKSDVVTDEDESLDDGGEFSLSSNNSKLNPNDPGPNVQSPASDERSPNHAILVTGAYDDNSLQVYTTWDKELVRWYPSMQVRPDVWMVNPYIIQTIPIQNGRSSARDLLDELNQKYGYTGKNASAKCPGEGGAAVVSRVENGAYDASDNPTFNPYDDQGQKEDPASSKDVGSIFRFNVEEIKQQGRRYLKISQITGCSAGPVNWMVSSTASNGDEMPANRAWATWQSKGQVSSVTYPISWTSDRYQVTGTCKDKRPFSEIVHGANADSGIR